MSEKLTLALIEEIKKRPILYDSRYETGGNKNSEKHEAWLKIASKLGDNENNLKNRWKGLKECFVKYKKSRSEKFLNSYDQYRNWKWASYLEFLEPHMKVLRNIEENNVQFLKEFDFQEETLNYEGDSEVFDDCQNNETPIIDSVSSTKYLSHNTIQGNSSEPLDDIQYLFLSYAQTFRKFSLKKQALLKVELAQLFSRYELDSFEEKDPIRF